MRLLILILLLPFLSEGQIIRANNFYTKKASGAFSPSDISGLKLWVKADQIGGLSDGDPVSTWSDQSGVSNDLTSSSTARPTYKTGILNSLPVVRFDGSNDFMEKTSPSGLSSLSGMTISIVAKQSSYTINKAYFSIWDYATQGQFAFQTTFSNSYSNEQLACFVADAVTDAGNNRSETTDNVSVTTWKVITLVYDGSQANANRLKFYVNGVLLGTSVGGTIPTSMTAATASLKMADFGNLSRFFNGDIAEAVIYNSALNSTDRGNVEGYLNAKYAIY